MSIVLNPYGDHEQWASAFAEFLPNEVVHLWPDMGDPVEVELVVAWRMKRDSLAQFTNLTHIFSLGAGVEQWQKPGSPDVSIVRLADPAMSDEMAVYAVHWVTHFQRRFDLAASQQRDRTWEPSSYVQAGDHSVGVLGYGQIGRRIAKAFTDLGYPVNSWSRSGGTDDGVIHFAGAEQLDDFLGASDSVVSVLPNTAETTGLLTGDRFASMRPDAVLVNIGRGTVLIEGDLVAALDSGHLKAAVLDVTNPEPPDPSSPLWGHPAVTLTPHIAGATQIRSSARLVAENIIRVRAGEAPFPLVDKSSGY